jgi:hypothetical protein
VLRTAIADDWQPTVLNTNGSGHVQQVFGTPLEIRIGAFRGRTVSALFKKYSQKKAHEAR